MGGVSQLGNWSVDNGRRAERTVVFKIPDAIDAPYNDADQKLAGALVMSMLSVPFERWAGVA